MRNPRFQVRTLMASAVVVALLLWGVPLALRSTLSYRLARSYEFEERGWRESAERARRDPTRSRSISAVWGSEFADYFGVLSRKYRRATWHPWEALAPDPPPPGNPSP